MEDTKPAIKSIGIVGPIVSLVVILVNQKWPGFGLTEADVGHTVDLVAMLVGSVAGIYGRWKATRVISGVVK